ncbi:MAG: glycosyltransferase [Gammaproteobacteria bacterium]|nr:glycosyltransferase [Gammaproteobacteria bacterium]
MLWAGLLVTPWQPWRNRETLEASPGSDEDFTDITVLIPARNEAGHIADTLRLVADQGRLGAVVLVDDQSDDGTGRAARASGVAGLTVVDGAPPPPGWSGKLWALEQGLAAVTTARVLLLDADIGMQPGMLAALSRKQRDGGLDLVSLMARLAMRTAPEKLLLPPFVYFFKLIYPFALANRPDSRVAAAAGGCILIDTGILRAIGGFEALKSALIDDCTLARLVKQQGGRTWTGLSHGVYALRGYDTLPVIWNMVARTAFTQLHYSAALLLAATLLLVLSFIVPLVGLAAGGSSSLAGAAALAAMLASFLPTVRYYRLHPAWTVTLPLAAVLYLAMTWTSALRYWRGERSRWKGRRYSSAAP